MRRSNLEDKEDKIEKMIDDFDFDFNTIQNTMQKSYGVLSGLELKISSLEERINKLNVSIMKMRME